MKNTHNEISPWQARLIEKYGQEVADRIWYEFLRVEGDYEFVDTFRACNPYDAEDLAQYNEIRDGGCCGSAEFQVTHKGSVYWFGFNYGH